MISPTRCIDRYMLTSDGTEYFEDSYDDDCDDDGFDDTGEE